MNEQVAQRIIDAFDVVREGIYPSWWTPQMETDVAQIKARYNEIKWGDISFGAAMRIAQTEFILRVCQESA
jgi:hypothetical protein